MKLLRMTATFGKLERETLTLSDGLNLLSLPNEGGKSTWAEFLLAMFYGVDTSEREKAGVLPVKTKYQPWSGKPMEGSLELEYQGARITLTRTSTARAPMSVFSAVYTESGLPVEGLTGQNCGETLLGVPKSVYQRSAFVRQAGLGLTPDDSLEARLSALVTTGDETVSYAAASRRLREQLNRVQHNKTGLLPDAERALLQTEERLRQLDEEQQKQLRLAAQRTQLEAQLADARQTLQDLQALDVQKKKQQLHDARVAAMQAANRENSAAALCARLPREDMLTALSQQAQLLLQTEEPEKPSPAPEKPACPPVFAGVEEERLLEKAQQDMHTFDRLTARRYRPTVPFWILGALLLAAAVGLWFWVQQPVFAAVCAALALGCALTAILNAKSNRTREAALDEAQALLARYGNRSRDEFPAVAADYREALRVWRAASDAAAEQAANYQAASRLRAEQTAALLGSVRMFADADTPQQAQEKITDALGAYGAYHAAGAAAQQAKAQYAALQQAFGELPEQAQPAREHPGLTPERAQAALAGTQAALAAVQSQLDQSRGRLDSLGGYDELEARRQTLAAQLETLRARQQALLLAAGTLEAANNELTSRFSPRLVQQASEIFAALTGGRYARVHVDRQMNLEAGAQDAAMRRLLSLSGGTADQLYLAVRLAICRLLLPDGAPIVLDDALVMFDDERLQLALGLLRCEAAGRQILLFTCQRRETALDKQG